MYGLSTEDTMRAIPEYRAIQSIEDDAERLKARVALDEKYSAQEDFNRYFMAGAFITDSFLLKRDESAFAFMAKARLESKQGYKKLKAKRAR